MAGKLNPGEIAQQLMISAFGSPEAWAGTLKETTPLLGCGIAAFIALRAGLFNIGVEGQFMMGALAAAVVALKSPPALAVPLGILCGTLAGALWAAPAGWIKAFRGGHEVITTIMLNEVSRHLSTHLLSGPFKDPQQQFPTTSTLPEGVGLPELVKDPMVSSGLLLILITLAGLFFWLKRTVKGYELEVVGSNVTAAENAGIDSRQVLWRSMLSSGALAGFAGSIQAIGYERKAYEAFSSGYGFDALGVALLAGSHPLLMIPSSLFFGGLKQGFSQVSALYGVPKGMSTFLLGLAIVAFAAYQYRNKARRES